MAGETNEENIFFDRDINCVVAFNAFTEAAQIVAKESTFAGDVRGYQRALFCFVSKLGVENRTSAATAALLRGILHPEDL